MKLKFFKSEDIEHKAKATVHKSGKLGFSTGAIGFLNLTENSSIAFGMNDEDENDPNLYAEIHQIVEEGAFKISKAGDYYYVNSKGLFDNIGLDYKNQTVIYDLVKMEYEGRQLIKMLKREIKKKKEVET